jgi:hypothetical protein
MASLGVRKGLSALKYIERACAGDKDDLGNDLAVSPEVVGLLERRLARTASTTSSAYGATRAAAPGESGGTASVLSIGSASSYRN